MTDTRPRVKATKPFDLAQLGREMGDVGLSADAETQEVVVVDGSAVTKAQLQSALDAHTPAPVEAEPDLAERLAAVEARLDKAANATVTGEAAKLRDGLKPTAL